MNFTGTLTNNGIVVANGGTLNLSSFSAVTENDASVDVVEYNQLGGTISNWVLTNSTNGWYAINGGGGSCPRSPWLPAASTTGARCRLRR